MNRLIFFFCSVMAISEPLASATLLQQPLRIAKSGDTVITAANGKNKAVVTISTTAIEAGCSATCPSSRAWAELGAKQVIVVRKMTIAVNGNSLGVPLSVYASLFEPGVATLRFEGGNFILRIDGADGADAYFVLLYFDPNDIRQLKVYDSEFPSHPVQITNFYPLAENGQ
jgi:hypothetical protein